MTNTATEPVVCKTAARVTKGADDSAEVGTFEVILSTPTADRDGEEVKAEEWKAPLPDHITFDVDHGMSVATTVGSGVPTLDDKGRLIVRGRWASTPLAQQTRALVNEDHIRTVSVAFLRLAEKDGAPQRELLNGAFVSVPANAEALILNSKSLQDQLAQPPEEDPESSEPEGEQDPEPTDPEGSDSASEDADPAADKAAGSASDDADKPSLDADAIAKARALAQVNSNLLVVQFDQ